MESPEKKESAYATASTLVIGLGLVVFMALWIIYNQYILRSSRLNLNHNLPVAVMALFLLLVAIRSLRPTWINRNRLILLTSMILGASYIPGDGLMSHVMGSWAMPVYFATPENQWETFHPYLKPWIVPLEAQGVRWFHEGLPDQRDLPWGLWFRPLVGWASVGLAMIAASIGLSSLFRKQWIENEKLTYPMMIPLQILAGDRQNLIRSSGKIPLFWVGFAVSFGVIAWNIVTFFNDQIPKIELNHGWMQLVSGGMNVFTKQINFLTLGLSYFASVEVLVSTIVFFIIKHAEIMVANRIGYTLPIAGGANHPGSSSALISWQTAGAFLVYVAWAVWTARDHIRSAFSDAIHNRPRQDPELLTSRAAFALILLGVTYVMLWLVAADVELIVAASILLALLVSYVGISKMSAEVGLPYLGSPLGAEAFTVAAVGTAAMRPASVLMLTYSRNFEGYNSGMIMSQLTVLQRLRGNLNPAHLLVGVLGALAAAYLVSMLYVIWMGYETGAYNFNSYTYTYYARQSYHRVVFRFNNHWPVDLHRLAILAIGGVAMAGMMGMRFKFPWWRLNSIGFAIPLLPHQFSTFVIAWLIKTTLLRTGGMEAFQRGIPFFVGLFSGHAAGVAASSLVDFIFFPRSGHAVHWW